MKAVTGPQPPAPTKEVARAQEAEAQGRIDAAGHGDREALLASEERLRLVLEASSMGTFEVDLKTGEGLWNDVEFALLGLKPGEVPTKPESFFRFVHPEDLGNLKAQWAEALRTGKLDTEFRIIRADGQECWLASKGRFVFEGESGEKALRFLGVNFDITERKRAEEALRASEERLARTQEIAHLGSWELDLVSNKLSWSDEVYRIFGLQPREFTATYEAFLNHVHPDDRAAVDAAYFGSLRENTDSYEIEHRVVRKSTGEIRWVQEKCRHVRDSHGKVLHSLGMVLDITEHKRAEELLQSQAKHLEVLVQERTAKLQETVNELEYFSYTITHDMRAPLRAMSGYGEILREQSEGLSEENRKFVERIITAAQRMDLLIVDALDYNKLVRQNFELTAIDCGALLRSMLESYPQYRRSTAHICIEGTLPAVEGNEALLTQCFSNLLNNAIKFVPPGTAPEVRIRAESKGDRVRIWFQDNGIGIPEDLRERIFLMFQRIHRNYEGTGIGLALVRKAAERMHGTVGVESEVGKGSRFWLEFKKATEPAFNAPV